MLILRILIVFVMAIVGYFVGFSIGVISLAIHQPAWKQLPPPPAEVTKLIPAAGESPLYIETLDGKTYHFEAEPLGNWVNDTSLQNIRAVDDLKEPCDLDAHEFSISPAPAPVDAKCFQSGFLWGAGFRYYTALVDEKGRVWEFDSESTPDTILVIPPALGLLGVAVGGAVGLAIAVFAFRKSKAQSEVVNEERPAQQSVHRTAGGLRQKSES